MRWSSSRRSRAASECYQGRGNAASNFGIHASAAPPSTCQELAEFWDTHDLTEFEDELEEVVGPVFVRGAGIKGPLESRWVWSPNEAGTLADAFPHPPA